MLAPLLCVASAYCEEENIANYQESDRDQIEALQPPALPKDLKPAVDKAYVLSPEEIRILRTLRIEVQKARVQELTPVRPLTRTTRIDIEPGSRPPILKMRINYDTAVSFLDALGNPWPVKPVSFGDNEAYSVASVTDNILVLHATTAFRESNFTVLLEGRTSPLVIHLVNGEEEVDYHRTMVIPLLSPSAQDARLASGVSEDVPVVNDPVLTQFLDGVGDTVPGAKPVQVLGEGVTAWKYKDRLILRTKMDLMTTAGAVIYGADGWRVYEVRDPMPVMLFSDAGNPRYITFALDLADATNVDIKIP